MEAYTALNQIKFFAAWFLKFSSRHLIVMFCTIFEAAIGTKLNFKNFQCSAWAWFVQPSRWVSWPWLWALYVAEEKPLLNLGIQLRSSLLQQRGMKKPLSRWNPWKPSFPACTGKGSWNADKQVKWLTEVSSLSTEKYMCAKKYSHMPVTTYHVWVEASILFGS